MAKWSWKRRAYAIQEFAYMMAENDDMPSYEHLTLEWTCLTMRNDLLDLLSDQDDESAPRQIRQINKFLSDFTSYLREPLPQKYDFNACIAYEKRWFKEN